VVQEAIAILGRLLSIIYRQMRITHSHDIGEEYLSRGRVDTDVIQRIELPAKIVVQQNSDVVGFLWVDESQGRREVASSRVNQEQVSSVWSRPSIRHLHLHRQVQLRSMREELY
jgi:hypothetical protein